MSDIMKRIRQYFQRKAFYAQLSQINYVWYKILEMAVLRNDDENIIHIIERRSVAVRGLLEMFERDGLKLSERERRDLAILEDKR